jgi:hypothetical protein
MEGIYKKHIVYSGMRDRAIPVYNQRSDISTKIIADNRRSIGKASSNAPLDKNKQFELLNNRKQIESFIKTQIEFGSESNRKKLLTVILA